MRSAYDFTLGACWLVGARRRAGSRVCLGSPPFARRGSVLPMRENGPPEEEGVAYFQTLEQRAASENFAQLPVPAKSGSAPARKACSACNLSRRPLSPVTPSCARLRAARPLIYEVLSC